MELNKQWYVFQDVNNTGEMLGVMNPKFCAEDSFLSVTSSWEAIDRLDYLQLLKAKQPYYGRQLRYFNENPWWFKNDFEFTKEERLNLDENKRSAVLSFEHVDYYAKVWLNGTFLGEHEGYFDSFSFEVGNVLQAGVNTLVVKVSSPNESQLLSYKQQGMDISPMLRFLMGEKCMVKGTYEHADTFIQRDVNPVGIWGRVTIDFYQGICIRGIPKINADPVDGQVVIGIQIDAADATQVKTVYTIRSKKTLRKVATKEMCFRASQGINAIEETLTLDSPEIWNTWDMGEPNLYLITVEILEGERSITKKEYQFGFRSIGLSRNSSKTQFYLNGEPVFLRGTNYFPDVYLSRMNYEKYERDLLEMKALGFNAVRVHVHVEQTCFYNLCDKIGIFVLQDSDLSWFHPTTKEFALKAVDIISRMVVNLRNHPSIFCWVLMNEPDMWKISEQKGEYVQEEKLLSMMDDCIGPELVEAVKKLDTRPYIKGSQFIDDLESGDDHNYIGSLLGEHTHYLDIYGMRLKLTTELGMDVPACAESLQRDERIWGRFKAFVEAGKMEEIYQYKNSYLKYILEYHRIKKSENCSGYFQFSFSDLCPQSFYGIYDWYHVPKPGIELFSEVNQPIGVFLEYTDQPKAIWAVNDTLTNYKCVEVRYLVTSQGDLIIEKTYTILLEKNSCIFVGEPDRWDNLDKEISVYLELRDMVSDKVLITNRYNNILYRPKHPEGHPLRVDSEIGMRIFGA